MRFIWKVVQHDVGGPIDHKNEAQLAISETNEAAVDVKKNRDNMAKFLEGIEKQTPQEKQDFDKKLTEWYQKGDKVSMRMAGVSEDENDPLKNKDGSLQRHKKLSSAFVTWGGKDGKLGGKIDFKENETAENKVGLGDLLPPNVKGVNVEKKSGAKVYCIRAQNPQTGRIGYYEAEALAKGQYLYVAVHSGDSFEVTRTIDPNDPKAQRAFLREHLAVYKKGAMESDGGEEVYYDNYGVAIPGTPAAYKASSEGAIKSDSSKRLAAFQQTVVPGKPPAPLAKPSAPRVTVDTTTKELIEINKKQYQRLTRQFLESNIGKTEAETSRWLVPTTFLEQKISVSPLVLPYLKEAESRIKAAGIDYKLNPAAGGCQCYSHRGMRKIDGSFSDKLSNHSWGIALDINPGAHPFGQKWEDNHNTNKVPMEIVKIMEDCGFHWGNDFSNADPMHFELAVNPFTSQDIIQSEEGKKAIDVMEQFSGKLGNDTRVAWNKPKVAPQTPSGAPAPKYAKEKPNSSIGKRLEQYQDIIVEAANQYNVPVNLIMAVITQESGGKPEIVSPVGAGGLMQLMPATATGAGLTVYPAVQTVNDKGRTVLTLDPRDDRMDPRKNIMAGVKLLGWLIKRYNGNLEHALSAYNWGPGNMDKLLKGQKKSMPAETQKYAPSILAMYQSLGGDTGSNPNKAVV